MTNNGSHTKVAVLYSYPEPEVTSGEDSLDMTTCGDMANHEHEDDM